MRIKWFGISKGDVISLLAVVLIIQILEYGAWLAIFDERFLDSLLTHARLNEARLSQDALYIVKIDDDAYARCFDSKSPLETTKLGAIVQTITSQAHPAVIGVDILTDANAFKAAYQSIAAKLNTGNVKSIWISGAEASTFERTNFFAWLFTGKEDEVVVRPTAVLGDRPADSLPSGNVSWGLPIYPRDEDLKLRRFPRQVLLSSDPDHPENRQEAPTWARLAAREYCRTHPCRTNDNATQIYMNFAANLPEEFALQELFDCSVTNAISRRATGGEAFWRTAANRIVLIGGTFRHSGDFYYTPRGLLSGVEINAYAIESDIDGLGFRAIRQPWSVLLDLAAGFVTLFVVSKTKHWRWLLIPWLIKSNEPRLSIVVSLALWFIVFWIVWLFANEYLLGIAGVVVGVLLDPFASTLRKNPRELDETHN